MASETLQHPVIVCTTCLKVKDASDIGKGTRKCLDCLRAAARARMSAKREDKAAYAAKMAEYRANGYDRTPERRKSAERQGRIYRPASERSQEAALKRVHDAADKARRKAEREAGIKSRPWNNPTLTSAEKFAMRYAMDPEFNLKQRVRAALKRKRQGVRLDNIIRPAIARGGRSPKAEAFLGYTMKDLHRHLERQFTKGMTWATFLSGDIHIDHIVPLSSFDLSDPDELRQAWCMTNLRPAWAGDNLAKGAKAIYLV